MVNNGIFYVMPFNLGHNSKERGYLFLLFIWMGALVI